MKFKHIRVTFFLLSILLCSFFAGCINSTRQIGRLLHLEHLNYEMETKKIDLSIEGQCPGTRSLNVVNSEMRTEKYCINDMMGCRMHIIPKDFADYVVKYTEEKLNESNIKTAGESNERILVSLEEVKAIEQGFTFSSLSKIKIEIPSIDYTQTYRGASGSGLGDYAVAYAIHLSVVELINDPVFQKYVTCNDDIVARAEQGSKDLKESPDTSEAMVSHKDIKPIAKTIGGEEVINIALFPMNIFSSEYTIGKYKETQNKVIRGIFEYVSDDPKVDFVLSYKQLPGYTEKAKLLSDISGIGHSNFWARKSVFSSLEPDWEKVQAVGLKTNANWAVFIRANIAHSTPTIVDVYFYEFETKEVTIKTEETGKYSIAEVAIRMIKETLGEDENKLRTK